jgi:SM-20-related protein
MASPDSDCEPDSDASEKFLTSRNCTESFGRQPDVIKSMASMNNFDFMDDFSESRFNAIADDLAEQGFTVVDNFLEDKETEQLVQLDEFQNGLLHMRKAGIGQQSDFRINESIRGDYIRWIDTASAVPPLKLYIDRLKEMMKFINRSLFLSLKDIELHMTVYPPGAYYKRHLDQFKPGDHRKLSVICYLNENWTVDLGGQLRMYLEAGMKDVVPLAGRLVCFRSDMIEHEVLPAKKERLSITGWMLDQQAELKHL